MPREIPVGNGSLLVVFDDDYCLRDIYFPRVGKENQTDGRQCRWGVWAEGRFRWIGKEWGLHFEYIEESLVSRVTAADKDIGVGLICNDMVDYEENIYIKKVQVRNNADREREFRVFFHQDFNLQESSLANTAYYDPDEKALIHYKGKRYFLASGMRNNMQGIDQYATGVKEFRGLAGTWKDAEDGMLSGNAIAQGSVDSVLSFTVRIPARGAATVHYWICAGEDYDTVRRLNRMIRGHGLEHFSKRTVNYWRAWVNKENLDLAPLPPHLQKLFKRSLLILQTNIDAGGAVIAGNDSDAQRYSRDTYGYMWPRDGALSVHALARAGYQGIAGNFFRFCFEIVRSGKESLGGYFLHKYNPDGSLGSSWHPWVSGSDKILPVQEDSTALVLWSLWNYFDRYRDIGLVSRLYEQLILRCGDFLASYRDDVTGLPLPSYDLWEEKWGIHTFTVSAVYGGIKAAEAFARFFKDTRRERIYSRAAARVRDALAAYI
jgi:GH15 family glucan-1,4-alpha-glucosidase